MNGNQLTHIITIINAKSYNFFVFFIKFAIVRPAAVLFISALASIAINGGLNQSSKSIIETIVSLVELGPAQKGYINLEYCADEKQTELPGSNFKPNACNNMTTEAVSVELVAEQLVKIVITLYLVALLLSFIFSILFPRRYLITSRPLRENIIAYKSNNQTY